MNSWVYVAWLLYLYATSQQLRYMVCVLYIVIISLPYWPLESKKKLNIVYKTVYSQRQIVVKATCLCVSGLQYNAALYIQYNVRRTAGYIHSYMKIFLAFSLNHENETNFSSIVLLSCQSTLVCCVYCIYRPFGILFITYVCLCTYYSTCH